MRPSTRVELAARDLRLAELAVARLVDRQRGAALRAHGLRAGLAARRLPWPTCCSVRALAPFPRVVAPSPACRSRVQYGTTTMSKLAEVLSVTQQHVVEAVAAAVEVDERARDARDA